MSEAPTPQTTHAVIVGIERYAAGSSWNLDGPASDAVRFLEYLDACGVPPANVRAYLAPLIENSAALLERAKPLAATIAEPSMAAINDLVTRELSKVNAQLLLFYWSGHGIITLAGERRLFTADAVTADKRNLDLNDLMAALRSHVYSNLDRQAIIVDTCANYVHNPTVSLPSTTFPKGDGVAGREQFALLAAAPGEYAKNLTMEKSGLMTRELMAFLHGVAHTDLGSWLSDLPSVAQQIAERFIALQRTGEARQTPVTYWYRDWSGNERYLSGCDTSNVPPGPAVRLPRALALDEKAKLLTALLQLRTMRERVSRDLLVQQLPPDIANHIERNNAARFDVMAILDTSRYYNGLAKLLQTIAFFEEDSPAMSALTTLARQIAPEEVAQSEE